MKSCLKTPLWVSDKNLSPKPKLLTLKLSKANPFWTTTGQVRCLYSLPFLGCYDSVISGFHSLSSNSTRRSPKPDWADGERWRRASFGCGRDYICCGGEGREAERNDAVLGGEELRREEYMPPPCSQAFTVWVFLLWSIEIWILSELLSGFSFQFLVLIWITS